MRKSGLYLITNKLNGHYYGGSSVDIGRRWGFHKSSSRKNRKNVCVRINSAIKKYGTENFEMKPILFCSPENVLFYEQRWLDKNVGKENCYNIATTAEAPFTGRHHSEEGKLRIGEASKGRMVSKETRKKLSLANSGINNHFYGKPSWMRGKSPSLTTIEKIRTHHSIKLWSFINPTGELVQFHNLTQFCKDNNLHQGCMFEVSIGMRGRTQHKGWRVSK